CLCRSRCPCSRRLLRSQFEAGIVDSRILECVRIRAVQADVQINAARAVRDEVARLLAVGINELIEPSWKHGVPSATVKSGIRPEHLVVAKTNVAGIRGDVPARSRLNRELDRIAVDEDAGRDRHLTGIERSFRKISAVWLNAIFGKVSELVP